MRILSALLLGFTCLFIVSDGAIFPGKVFPGRNGSGSVVFAKGTGIYYESTIKQIIRADCGRCHSGPTRNLMDYDSLKAYAESGFLQTMVQGPMRRFAGNDVGTIVKWIEAGAPEKPNAAAPVRFSRKAAVNTPACPNPGTTHGTGGAVTSPGARLTYDGAINDLLAKDCLRCHSGPFRNMTTYENVKRYVDNGLLKTLVLPGGPMHRFAGPDTHLFIAWINNGAPK